MLVSFSCVFISRLLCYSCMCISLHGHTHASCSSFSAPAIPKSREALHKQAAIVAVTLPLTTMDEPDCPFQEESSQEEHVNSPPPHEELNTAQGSELPGPTPQTRPPEDPQHHTIATWPKNTHITFMTCNITSMTSINRDWLKGLSHQADLLLMQEHHLLRPDALGFLKKHYYLVFSPARPTVKTRFNKQHTSGGVAILVSKRLTRVKHLSLIHI